MTTYAPFPHNAIIAKRKWFNWLTYKIEVDEGELVARHRVIREFVEINLLPFLKKNGYQMACDPYRVSECISRVLYFGHSRHEYLNTDYLPEDYDHYYWSLSDDKWEAFWYNWKWWSDLGDEHRHLHEEIRFCIWTLLDLDTSKQTRILNELLGIREDDDNSSNCSDRGAHRDPYLKDLERGYYN